MASPSLRLLRHRRCREQRRKRPALERSLLFTAIASSQNARVHVIPATIDLYCRTYRLRTGTKNATSASLSHQSTSYHRTTHVQIEGYHAGHVGHSRLQRSERMTQQGINPVICSESIKPEVQKTHRVRATNARSTAGVQSDYWSGVIIGSTVSAPPLRSRVAPMTPGAAPRRAKTSGTVP